MSARRPSSLAALSFAARSFARSASVVGALFGALSAGCSYSWEIGKGGTGGSGSSGEGGGGSTGSSTSSTTSSSSAPDCAALGEALKDARAAAQKCSYAGAQAQGECAAEVTDECGCSAFVKSGSSPESAAFTQAVADFESAGCSPTCSTCSPAITGACLQNVTVIHCVP